MLAFCFLTYKDVDHLEVWAPFFAAAPPDQYAIFIHRKEGTGSELPATVIPTQPTEWGTWSLMEAQQSLFRMAAISDPAITKFILISNDTVPLYSFAALYAALMADDKGYIRKMKHKKSMTKIPNLEAWPSSMPFNWSLTSQWVILNRAHVIALEEHFVMLRTVFETMLIPDEHVYIIFFEGLGLLGTFHLVPPVHVQWDQKPHTLHTMLCQPITRFNRPPVRNRACSEWHRNRPHTFHAEEFTKAKVAEIYRSGAFFLRKVCRIAPLSVDLSRERILLPKP
jgi:hypothetical protein